MENLDIVNVIQNEYKISIKEIEKNKESTDGNVYIIDGENKRYVLKVYTSEKHAINITNIHQLLKENNISAPKVIKNKNNMQITFYNGLYLVLYSFVEGIKIKQLNLNSNIINSIANELRLIHGIEVNNKDIPNVPFEINSERKSILHFDVTKNNIFYDSGKIIFIDFDDAKFGPSVCDVAIAITNLFISRADGADEAKIWEFIDAYYKDNVDLKSKEVPLIKEAATMWLNSTINNSNLDTSIKKGLENKLYWINKIF